MSSHARHPSVAALTGRETSGRLAELMMCWHIWSIEVLSACTEHVGVGGRRTAAARIVRRRHRVLVIVRVIVVVEVVVLFGHQSLMVLVEHVVCQFVDQVKRLPSLVTHQTHCRLVDHSRQNPQVIELEVFVADEVVGQVALQLSSLLTQVTEVNEEPGAHVPLQDLYLLVSVRVVIPDQQVAILEKTSATDLFWLLGSDQFLLEMKQSFSEVSVDTLADDRRVEVFADWHRFGALVELKKTVQNDMEGVDAELVLPLHLVDELYLHVSAALVGQ